MIPYVSNIIHSYSVLLDNTEYHREYIWSGEFLYTYRCVYFLYNYRSYTSCHIYNYTSRNIVCNLPKNY